MTKYAQNHYVPEWYQHGFLIDGMKEKKFKYLDLHPPMHRDSRGHLHQQTSIRRWGPASCFKQENLYTLRFGEKISKVIETDFFGGIDDKGKHAVRFWASYDHKTIDHDAYGDLIDYMIMQKLRTPKALAYISGLIGSEDNNELLVAMQSLRGVYGAVWSEAEWAVVDASGSDTKFILTDHPVTIYNPACPPSSRPCIGALDPDPRFNGSFTLFPLTRDKLIILTNKSWVRNPYGNPMRLRPNPRLDRSAVFNFTGVHLGRHLSEAEVLATNYVLKSRAYRYIAAPVEEWLYPERHLASKEWASLGDGLLFMPDPRTIYLGGEIIMGGYPDGRPADIWDEYGRRPGQRDFKDAKLRARESHTFRAFQGEFARLFGPKYRGFTARHGRAQTEASEDYHQIVLEQEDLKFTKIRRGRTSPLPAKQHLAAKKQGMPKGGA